LVFDHWVDGIIPDGHGVILTGTAKRPPLTKSDVSRIQGLPDDMLQEIGNLILQKKVCCKSLQPGVAGLVSLADMCD